MTTFVEPSDFVSYVEGRGYKAEPLLNTLDVGLDRAPLRIVGYTMRGPRGNKKVVGKNADGLLPLFDAQLWCDGVDYSTSAVERLNATGRYRRDGVAPRTQETSGES